MRHKPSTPRETSKTAPATRATLVPARGWEADEDAPASQHALPAGASEDDGEEEEE